MFFMYSPQSGRGLIGLQVDRVIEFGFHPAKNAFQLIGVGVRRSVMTLSWFSPIPCRAAEHKQKSLREDRKFRFQVES
jgi:hypothetical protein